MALTPTNPHIQRSTWTIPLTASSLIVCAAVITVAGLILGQVGLCAQLPAIAGWSLLGGSLILEMCALVIIELCSGKSYVEEPPPPPPPVRPRTPLTPVTPQPTEARSPAPSPAPPPAVSAATTTAVSTTSRRVAKRNRALVGKEIEEGSDAMRVEAARQNDTLRKLDTTVNSLAAGSAQLKTSIDAMAVDMDAMAASILQQQTVVDAMDAEMQDTVDEVRDTSESMEKTPVVDTSQSLTREVLAEAALARLQNRPSRIVFNETNSSDKVDERSPSPTSDRSGGTVASSPPSDKGPPSTAIGGERSVSPVPMVKGRRNPVTHDSSDEEDIPPIRRGVNDGVRPQRLLPSYNHADAFDDVRGFNDEENGFSGVSSRTYNLGGRDSPLDEQIQLALVLSISTEHTPTNEDDEVKKAIAASLQDAQNPRPQPASSGDLHHQHRRERRKP